MRKIPLIGWTLLTGTGIPAAIMVYMAIISRHHPMGERVMVAVGSVGWFLTIVGICVYARYQQKKTKNSTRSPAGNN